MDKLEWQTHEYIHRDKTADWYWILAIITVSVVIISIILNNLIFAILVIISAITLALYATRQPKIITIEITESGIKIGDEMHLYGDIESFWIETRDSFPRIFIKSKKKLSLYTTVLLGDMDPGAVHDILSNHLVETEHTEPFLEKLMLYFGF
jgi:hypothetical protein